MTNLVRIHNNLTDIPLDGFSSGEIDIFNALCYICQNRHSDKIVVSLNEIQKLAKYHTKDRRQFIHRVFQVNEKLLTLRMATEAEGNFEQFALFSKFEIDSNERTLTICIASNFAYLFNDLDENNSTVLDINKAASFVSKHSKLIYRKLMEHYDSGVWYVGINEFRRYCGISANTSSTMVNQKIINPAIKELSPIFRNLRIKKTYASSSKAGRPPISGYHFAFKAANKADVKNKRVFILCQI